MADLGKAYVQIVPSAQGISGSISEVLGPEAQKAGQSAGKDLGDNLAVGVAKGAAVVAAAVAATVGAVMAAVNATAEWGDTIDKQSQKVGLSAKAYQEWDYVLNRSGTSMQNMNVGLKTLTNKMDDAKNGSKDAQKMFEKLGITMDDLGKMSREDLFEATIKGMQNMGDSTERAALANDLFGRSGQELAPVFNMTNEETEELIKNVNELGGIMSEEAVKASADYEDAMLDFKMATQGVRNSIALSLMPTITDFINNAAGAVGQIDWSPLADDFGNVGDKIKKALENIDWDSVIDNINSIIELLATLGADVKGTIAPSIDNLKESWEDLNEAIQPLIDVLQPIIDKLNESSIASDLLHAAVGRIFGDFNGLAAIIKFVAEDINLMKERFNTIVETIQNTIAKFQEFKASVIASITTLKTNVITTFTTIKSTITGKVQEAISTAKSKVEELKTKFSDTFDKVKSTVSDAIETIKGYFNFSWSLPDIKLPHFKISGSFSLDPPSVPSFSVQWYRRGMQEAMLLDGATIFGMLGGNMLGGGEAGKEYVVGEERLLELMRDTMAESNAGVYNLLKKYLPMLSNTTIELNDREVGRVVRRYA